jgi:hypothetical protein
LAAFQSLNKVVNSSILLISPPNVMITGSSGALFY